ncbi:MAG: hypothetical protein KDE27_00320 [Planctomycetes bacterium]|nr:hypothetical protein [Planctomycetota bacterium]
MQPATAIESLPLRHGILPRRRWLLAMLLPVLHGCGAEADDLAQVRRARTDFDAEVHRIEMRLEEARQRLGAETAVDLTDLETRQSVADRQSAVDRVLVMIEELRTYVDNERAWSAALENAAVSPRGIASALEQFRGDPERARLRSMLTVEAEWYGSMRTFITALHEYFGSWSVDASGGLVIAGDAAQPAREAIEAAQAALRKAGEKMQAARRDDRSGR